MQRKNLTAKVGAAVLAASMMMSLGTPVLAAGSNYSGTIGGTKTTTFDKYLVMDQQANVPTVEFSYAVTAGAAKTYNLAGKTFEILEGVNPEAVTMAGVGTATANKIAYKAGDATAQDDNQYVKDYDKTTEKYAKKTATLDFTGCKFPEPGVYRYVVTESGSTQAITNDADLTRIVDVYVDDESDSAGKKLKISGYVLHSNENDSPDVGVGDDAGTGGTYTPMKSQGFTNSYDTSDLTLRKEVAGNQASHDKYFEFTLNITHALPNTVYDVDITGADATSGSNAATIAANTGKANVTKITTDATGNATAKFYLQHGQEVKVQGIAKDTQYTVTENKEDYKSEGAAVEGYKDATAGTVVSTDLKTSYLNTRLGTVPTGVIMAVAPFAVVTLLGAAGITTMVMKKKRDDE